MPSNGQDIRTATYKIRREIMKVLLAVRMALSDDKKYRINQPQMYQKAQTTSQHYSYPSHFLYIFFEFLLNLS